MRLLERPLSPTAAIPSTHCDADVASQNKPDGTHMIWRSIPSFICGPVELERLRRLLGEVAILGEPRWRAAASGDAAAAIGVAMDICDPEDGPSPLFDLAMSALFACVIEDDPAACLVFANVVRRADWLDHIHIDPVDLHELMVEGLADPS